MIIDDYELHREMYCKIYLLNESLFGQTEMQIEKMYKESQMSLNINFSNCFLIIAGLDKKQYTKNNYVNRDDVVDMLYNLKNYITLNATNCKCEAEIGVLNYDFTKRYIIVLSNVESKHKALVIAQDILNYISLLHKSLDISARNFVVLSNKINSFKEYQSEFVKLNNLYQTNFFNDSTDIFTYDDIYKYKNNYGYTQLKDNLDEIDNYILKNDTEKLKVLVSDIFLNKLKYSYDKKLCENAICIIKDKLYNISCLIGGEGYVNINGLIEDLDRYETIEKLYIALEKNIIEFCDILKDGKKDVRLIVAKSVAYIQKNYRKDISLSDVAWHIKINPAYLSRTFKKEIGIGVVEYINTLKIESAKKMLITQNDKIAEIAYKIGFVDKHYFSILFKKYTGVTPTQYKKDNTVNK